MKHNYLLGYYSFDTTVYITAYTKSLEENHSKFDLVCSILDPLHTSEQLHVHNL